MAPDLEIAVTCPVPVAENQKIMLAHGGGGRLMHRLLDDVILPALHNDMLAERHDCAVLPLPASASARLAFTTDSYVVRPLFFPGGDIGTLAVNGTVNDLAMGGARPIWLSAGFVLEEGLPWETLRRICESLRLAGDAAGVSIVTGDTKVVERGKGDGIFINTSGIGVVEHTATLGPHQRAPRRRHPSFGRRRTPWHCPHGRARRHPPGGCSGKRLRPAGTNGPAAFRCGLTDPLPARPDAWRPGQRPGGNRRGLPLRSPDPR